MLLIFEFVNDIIMDLQGNKYILTNLKNIVNYSDEDNFHKKAWMHGMIFESWIMKLDKKFKEENRNVYSFFDNCSAHEKEDPLKLEKIRIELFLANLLAILQHKDNGIIRCTKAHHRNSIKKLLMDTKRRYSADLV